MLYIIIIASLLHIIVLLFLHKKPNFLWQIIVSAVFLASFWTIIPDYYMENYITKDSKCGLPTMALNFGFYVLSTLSIIITTVIFFIFHSNKPH